MTCLDFSVAEWIDFLENRHQQEIQLGLSRVKTVADRLGLLHLDATVITVAGTNGKGSTVAALESIYHTAGYQVASYTSPYLMKYNERVRINQEPISDDDLCLAFIEIERGRGDIHLTYFEVGTLAALWHFKHMQIKLDVIILEVGMGGRLDATNIIDSDLAIITTIDFDHQAFLGDTIEEIGYEKAGILRLNKPYIYADKHLPASILGHAALLNSPRLVYSYTTSNGYMQLFPLSGETIKVSLPRINHNAAAAAIIASMYFHSMLPVTLTQLEEAMRTVHIKGRQEVVKGPVDTIFDVAHNPQAVSLLADFIKNYQVQGNVHAVFSGLKDKDICGLIKPMKSYVDFWYPALLSGKRAASESLLLSAFKTENRLVNACFESPSAAYLMAMQRAKPGDVIVVYGSFLTVSGVLAADRTEQEELR